MDFPNDFKEFIGLLNARKVKYLVAGGYAVAFHGYPRYTGDIDFWFDTSIENLQSLSNALSDFGFSIKIDDLADMASSEKVIQLGYPPVRIDLLSFLDGVTFDDCFERKVIDGSQGLPINYISKNDLKVNKQASGRHRDLDDLENL